MKYTQEITSKTKINSISHIGQEVFVAWLPNEAWIDVYNKCEELHIKGYKPVPHIIARQISNRVVCSIILSMIRGITDTVLLIRGSGEKRGEYDSVQDLVDTGLFEGLKIGVVGFPNGNGKMPYHLSMALLVLKAKFAVFVVTQMELDTNKIKRFLNDSPLPVLVGMPIKCNRKRLMRFCSLCGVNVSFKAFMNNPINFIRLIVFGFNPNSIISDIVGYKNLIGIHTFTFGKMDN